MTENANVKETKTKEKSAPKKEAKAATTSEPKEVKKGVDAAKTEGSAPAVTEAGGETGATTVKKRKKSRKNVPVGVVHIQSTFNNTIITFADVNGNTVAWATTGSAGFKGSRKSTPFAAQIAAEAAAGRARDAGMRSVTVYMTGPGSGRESAVRAIQKSGIRITGMRDVTPIPHNGCRPPKRRRI